MPVIDRPKLDAREAHFCVPSDHAGLSLFLRYLAPDHSPMPDRRVVLYVHGATFPSALSIAHRFDGRSWRDELVACGFHTWALDFHGFGQFSDPYPEMDEPAETTARARARRQPSARARRPLHLRTPRGEPPVDYRPFLGDHRGRRFRRTLPHAGRPAGLL
jgi:hypothetical protein